MIVNYESAQKEPKKKKTFASTWGKPIMKTLNPLGESPILDCSNVARKNGKTACRSFYTSMTVLIKSHFFLLFQM
jgi:hypothetical protein